MSWMLFVIDIVLIGFLAFRAYQDGKGFSDHEVRGIGTVANSNFSEYSRPLRSSFLWESSEFFCRFRVMGGVGWCLDGLARYPCSEFIRFRLVVCALVLQSPAPVIDCLKPNGLIKFVHFCHQTTPASSVQNLSYHLPQDSSRSQSPSTLPFLALRGHPRHPLHYAMDQ